MEKKSNDVKNIFENKKDKENKRDYFTLSVIIVCIMAILLNSFVIQLACVSGPSMNTTLADGELLLVSKIAKYTNNYERGDIIVFRQDGRFLIKRLIGLPNENVKIIDNDIYINDEKIQDYVNVEMNDTGLLKDGITLKDNEYIFLGDNRNNSIDSRDFGCINASEIVGKVIFRFIPLSTF